jgi:hypothetical protein
MDRQRELEERQRDKMRFQEERQREMMQEQEERQRDRELAHEDRMRDRFDLDLTTPRALPPEKPPLPMVAPLPPTPEWSPTESDHWLTQGREGTRQTRAVAGDA